MKNKFITIESTFPNLRAAKKVAKILLQKNLAACVQFTKIESTYLWQKKIENCSEIQVKIKTKKTLYAAVEKTIIAHHPYEIPQITSKLIDQGFTPYLEWIDSSIETGKIKLA